MSFAVLYVVIHSLLCSTTDLHAIFLAYWEPLKGVFYIDPEFKHFALRGIGRGSLGSNIFTLAVLTSFLCSPWEHM